MRILRKADRYRGQIGGWGMRVGEWVKGFIGKKCN